MLCANYSITAASGWHGCSIPVLDSGCSIPVVVMRRQKLVQIWHDRQIPAGDDWAGEIDEHLNSADIITLFVSPDFLASDYCFCLLFSVFPEHSVSGAGMVIHRLTAT